jgi:hypothetical protein
MLSNNHKEKGFREFEENYCIHHHVTKQRRHIPTVVGLYNAEKEVTKIMAVDICDKCGSLEAHSGAQVL